MIFSIPLCILFYMWGGQTMKWIRPTGVALSLYIVSILYGYSLVLSLPCLLYGLELTMGYGEKSLFYKIAHKIEWLDRLLYSLFCCIPVLILAFLFKHYFQLIGCILIIGSFQVHLGGFKIGKYDFLWEDFFRSLAISLTVTSTIYG